MSSYTNIREQEKINKHYDEKTKEKIRRRNNRQKQRQLPWPLSFFEKKGWLRIGMGMDFAFLFLIFALLIIGMIMMFSASYPKAHSDYENSYYYLEKQLIFAIIGVAGMIAVSFFNYNLLHKFAIPVLLLSYVALVVVLFVPSASGIHRWFELGAFRFQASEITKFAIILFFAHWGSKYYNKMDNYKYSILPVVIIFGTTALLLFLEPHYSCIVIVALLSGVMAYLYGIPTKWIVATVCTGAVLIAILYSTGALSYAMDRIGGLGKALEYTTEEMWQTTWQTRNSLYAIGSGGLFGLGLGQSRQKYGLLPEPQNDFIFAIVCEELGFVGAIIILLIFALLVWRGINMSLRAKDKFGKLLGIGLTSQVGIQVILNILVITDMLPNTGISLPFFSYGGTSLIMCLLQMGVVLSISRTANIEKQ